MTIVTTVIKVIPIWGQYITSCNSNMTEKGFITEYEVIKSEYDGLALLEGLIKHVSIIFA